MKNFWKKHKVQIVLTGYGLFLGIFIYGGIFTMVKSIRQGADEIQKKIIDNEIDNKNLAGIPQLIGDYEIFSAQENNLNVILEKEKEIQFIQSLENLAKETGNEISLKLIAEEMSQDKQEKTAVKGKKDEEIKNALPYKNYVMIQLELRGGYQELLSFLKKLENMEYYANVVAFDLKKEENRIEEASGNPFVSSGSGMASEENNKAADQKKEILKSLIDLVVYIR
jgi:hypothetical protein